VRIRLACLLALAAAATAVAVPGSLGRGQAQPRCVAGQLTGKVLGSSGAAGTIVVSIVLRNGGPPCTLKGYAGLQMYAGSGRPIRTRVQHGSVPGVSRAVPRLVTLPHRGRATIVIAYSDVPVGNERRCPIAKSLAVRVPDTRGRIVVHLELTPCNRGQLRESPILAGVVPPP
jgi:hypothetical protein